MTDATTPVPDIDVRAAVEGARDGAILIDVREQHEWDAGHAPSAVHMPLGNLDAAALPAGLVLAVCRSGSRSSAAARQLAAAGVDVRNVAGGMQAWAEAHLPLVTSGAHATDEPTIA